MNDFLQQVATLFLRQANQSFALPGIGLGVDDEYRFCGSGLLNAQRIAGRDDGDDAEAVEPDIIKRALVDLPAHDRVAAGEIDHGIGEARSGPDVAVARLNVLSGNSGRGDRRSHGNESDDGEREPA